MRKTGRLAAEAPTLAMQIGLLAEPIIGAIYEREGHGTLGRKQIFYRDPDRPFVTATVDALEASGRVVEFKLLSPFRKDEIAELDAGEVPSRWTVQVHQQMHVAGADEADVAVLIGFHAFRVVRVRRYPDLVRMLLEEEERFWGHVESGRPPLDRPTRSLEVIQALYPHCRGVSVLDDVAAGQAQEFVRLGAQIRDLESRRNLLKAELLSAMGESEVAELPDGRSLVRKVVTLHHEARPARTSQQVRFSVKEGRP